VRARPVLDWYGPGQQLNIPLDRWLLRIIIIYGYLSQCVVEQTVWKETVLLLSVLVGSNLHVSYSAREVAHRPLEKWKLYGLLSKQ
jgi:hypothetical protein